MEKSIEDGFQKFLKRLTPLKTETEAAKRHRASIEKCLKNHFEMNSFFRTGSFGNGTSIRKYSDVDCFAVIPVEHLKQNPKNTLIQVKRKLRNRFPNTEINIKSPAIQIPFGNLKCESTEIVPADLVGYNEDGFEIYDIPGPNGSWIKSSPKAHNKLVVYVDEKLNHKLRPLIRFIKAWKYIRQVPISSFYLEIFITKYCLVENSIYYPIDILNILNLLLFDNVPVIEDPMKIAGSIIPCNSELAKRNVIHKLKLHLPIIEKANKFDELDKPKLAFNYWRGLYKGNFPTH